MEDYLVWAGALLGFVFGLTAYVVANRSATRINNLERELNALRGLLTASPDGD